MVPLRIFSIFERIMECLVGNHQWPFIIGFGPQLLVLLAGMDSILQ